MNNQITITWIDGNTYNFTLNGSEPQPPSNEFIFETAGGRDETERFQNWVNNLPAADCTAKINGIVDINERGIVISDKTNIRFTTDDYGGFRAISQQTYQTPYSSLVYVANTSRCVFEGLIFNGNGSRAQGIFIHKSERPEIIGCEVYDIKNSDSGPPFAGIKVDACQFPVIRDCYIHNLGGAAGKEGVRGIWCGVNDSEYCVQPLIEGNVIENTGHTGISTESSGPIIRKNQVMSVSIQGTGYKFIPRGEPLQALFEENLVNGTHDSGIMIEGSNSQPQVIIQKFEAFNIGHSGSSFGFAYLNRASRVTLSDNLLHNCKRVANLNNCNQIDFLNNDVSTGDSRVALESNNNTVYIDNSGTAELGSNNTNIYVNGVKVA